MRESARRLVLLFVAALGLPLVVLAQTAPSQPSKVSARPTTLPAIVLPQKAGTHRLSCSVRVDGKALTLPYVLFLPDCYKAKGPKTPVLLFLHGLGETGTDLDAIFYHGPNFELEKPGNDTFRHNFPMIVISPQCPPRGQRWDRENMDQYLNALLDEVLPTLNVDLDRVYATGLSMGGLGTWRVASDRPDRYAAIMPISSYELDPETTAQKLKNVAVLAITGEGDNPQIEQSRTMIDALHRAGALAEQVTGPDGHAVWIPTYASPRVYEWLLLNNRGQTRPAAQSWPENRGFHRLAWSPEKDPTRKVDYIIHLPTDIRPGSNAKRPLLVYFPDPNEFGVFSSGIVVHGPTQFMRPLPFVIVQPVIPPFLFYGRGDGDVPFLCEMVQTIARQYNADPQRIFVSGRGEGARIALILARAAKPTFAAAILDVESDSQAFNNVNPEQGSPTIILGITDKGESENQKCLQALIDKSLSGSELAVKPPNDAQRDPFSYSELHTRLLRIRLKADKPSAAGTGR